MSKKEEIIQADAEPQSSLLSLIESYAPQGETIDILLSKGEVLTYRNVQDSTEIRKLHSGATNFVESVGNAPNLKQFEAFKGLDEATLQRVYVLAEIDANDGFGKTKIEKRESYAKLAKKAGYLFREIHMKVDARSYNYEWGSFAGPVEEAKKNSSPE